MGLSISASAAIMFVAFVVCFAALLGAVSEYQEAVGYAAQHDSERIVQAASTSIDFESYDGVNGSFTLVNSGQSTLALADLEVLVDGVLLSEDEFVVSVVGHEGSGLAFSGDLVSFDTGMGLDGRRVMVITASGLSITYTPHEVH